MVAVAIVAVVVTNALTLQRRRERFRQLAEQYVRAANRIEVALTSNSVGQERAAEILEVVHGHDRLYDKYARAARYPKRRGRPSFEFLKDLKLDLIPRSHSTLHGVPIAAEKKPTMFNLTSVQWEDGADASGCGSTRSDHCRQTAEEPRTA